MRISTISWNEIGHAKLMTTALYCAKILSSLKHFIVAPLHHGLKSA